MAQQKKISCDVLLINPPAAADRMPTDSIITDYFSCISSLDFLGDSDVEPNYGLFSIAAYLRSESQRKNEKVNIEYIDLNLIDQNLRTTENRPIGKDDLEKIFARYSSCGVAGISFMTASFGTWAETLIPIVKDISAHVVLGGIHPTVRYREILKQFKELSGIVVGEGERIFYEIVHEVIHNGCNLERIKNFCTPQKLKNNPNVLVHPARLESVSLSELPVPAYDIFYKESEDVIARVYSSRGCINTCSICSVGSFFRTTKLSGPVFVDIDSLINTIGQLYDSHKVKHFVLGDLDISDKMRLSIFLDKLILLNQQKGIDKDWWCQTRGDSTIIDTAIARKLLKAGFKQVAIGCEGATDRQLQMINKNEKVRNVKKALKTLTGAGLSTQGYWIIGLPYDTVDSVKQTQATILEYLESGIVTVPHITILVPYPNTDLEKNEGTNGIRIINKNYRDYWMNCDLYGCGKPVYETIDRNGKTLLTSDQIYELWRDTLKKVTEFYNKAKE